MALTAKQRRFVDEYIKDLNASQAAIRAGYSAISARNISSGLMTKANIQQAIAEKMGKRSERTAITADRVLQELARLAFLDVRKAFTAEGALRPIHELDDDTAAAVAGIDITEMGMGDDQVGVVKKIKLSDKKGALELLMRHLGMNTTPANSDLDGELKRIEIERRKIELERMKQGGGASMEDVLRDLIARMPG